MTPREEAEELVFKLLDKAKHPYKEVTFEQSRLCALICVDEKQETIDKMFACYYTMPEEWRREYDRLEEVKQEINKM